MDLSGKFRHPWPFFYPLERTVTMSANHLTRHLLKATPNARKIRIYEDGQVHVLTIKNGRKWWSFLGMKSDLESTLNLTEK